MSCTLLLLLLIFYTTRQVCDGLRTGFHSATDKFSGVKTGFHSVTDEFGSHNMRWQKASSLPTNAKKFPPIVCIHGFGGNSDQFRKNIGPFAEQGSDCYAVDLIGYGYSDKPDPRQYQPNSIYNFENWATHIADFIEREVQEPSFLVCNSVGGVVGLQAAVHRPDLVKGLVLSNMSLRLLHTKKQNPIQRPFTSLLQTTLRETGLGKAFFTNVRL